MYDYRKMTAAQRHEIVEHRRRHERPCILHRIGSSKVSTSLLSSRPALITRL